MTSCRKSRLPLVDRAHPLRAALVACCALALLLFAPASPAHAQGPLPTLDACETTKRLTLTETLPLELLDHLEKISASPFVNAFLLSYVAERGDTTHAVTRCILQFLDAPPDSIVKLRATRVKVGTLIRELRDAERNRLRQEELRARLRVSLDTVVLSLLHSPQDASLPVYTALLASAKTACTEGPVCRALDTTQIVVGHLRTTQETLARLTDQHDKLSEQLTAAGRELELARSRAEADSAALQTITEAVLEAPQDPVRQQLGLDAARAVIQRQASAVARQTAEARITELSATAQTIGVALGAATAGVDTTVRDVSRSLSALLARLSTPSGSRFNTQLDLAGRQDVRVNALLANPPSPSANQGQQTRSASVLLELTDFVIARAKQEVVLSFLATLYGAMRRDSILQSAFPQTHQLMRGLTVPDESRLSVVAAGRIQLSVWRATLKADFHTLPINLLQAPDALLCSRDDECRGRVQALRPVAGIVGHLLEGQPVLEVIRDAPHIATTSGAPEPSAIDPFIQGLRLVSAVTATYQVQGLAQDADPIRHPYVLSVSALRIVDEKQLAAFTRLLLLDITPSTETRVTVNAGRLTDATRRATTAVEAVATATNSNGSTVEQARRLLGSAVSALRAADGIATLFTGNGAPSEPGIRKYFLDVAEPLVVRDYALAMSRAAVLLHELTGAPISRNLLTLASLAASLAEARSGAEVRAALETAASPVGGWEAKRYREGSGRSITAFPGFAYGGEWLKDGPYSRTAGAALPIGPEVQLLPRASSAAITPGCWLRVICSLGAFMPIIDLGTLLSYRLKKSDDVKSAPNTGFRQVVAPGGYLTVGLWHSPFALLMGGQFIPNMREVEGESDISGHAWRLGAAITVDVMLFKF